jgi:hypothetical protein
MATFMIPIEGGGVQNAAVGAVDELVRQVSAVVEGELAPLDSKQSQRVIVEGNGDGNCGGGGKEVRTP